MSSTNHRSAAYRLPGVAVLAALAAGAIYTAHRAEQSFSETSVLTRTAPKQLRLHSTQADVEIAPGSGKAIVIELRARWVGNRPSHAVTRVNGTYVLGGRCRHGVNDATALFTFHDSCSLEYRVSVPPGQSIHLQNDSGDTSLTNLRGAITVTARSGDISAHGLSGGQVQLDTQSGDVSASLTRAPRTLGASTQSGDVSLRVPAGAYRLFVTANSGDRSVSGVVNNRRSKRVIAAKANSGDVSVTGTNR